MRPNTSDAPADPNGTGSASGHGRRVWAFDPNDIIGPAGVGTESWIAGPGEMGYTIRFENDPKEATAPAQTVRITQQLDTDLDCSTFALGGFGFGDFYIPVPDGAASYEARLDVRDSLLGVYVDVKAGIDVEMGQAFWEFVSVDPATGDLPADPFAGFLPPNIQSPAGEGYVTYTVRPKAGVASGEVIDAQAAIVFDINDPINTPAILNTLDVAGPSSSVVALPAETTETEFIVSWTGLDEPGGSGIGSYDIHVSMDSGPYTLWQDHTTGTSATFTGLPNHTYAFYSTATDNVGHTESAPLVADAQTTLVAGNTPPALDPIADQSVAEGQSFTFTAAARDNDPGQTLIYSLLDGAPPGAAIDPATGVFTWTPTEAQGPGAYNLTVQASDGELTDSKSFTITVNEVNVWPTINPITGKTINEGQTLTFTVTAMDIDFPVQSLTYNLVNAPAGAAIDPATGLFIWTPSEVQGPGNYRLRVLVSDGELTAAQAFMVTVNEVNVGPTINPITDKTINKGENLSFTASAIDADLPANTLTFSLASDAPQGAAIDPATGLFTWTPSGGQGPGDYSVTVNVVDSGSPVLSDSTTFNITVLPATNVDAGGFAGDGLPDTFRIIKNGDNLQLIVNKTLVFTQALSLTPSLTVRGSSDNDTFIINYSTGVNLVIDPGQGSNKVTDNTGSAIVRIAGTGQADTIKLVKDKKDNVVAVNTSINTLINVNKLEIYGLGGNDRITLTGKATSVSIDGGAGNDIINAFKFTGGFTVTGGDGNDTITGTSGNDIIYADMGKDSIDGGAGTDTIDYSNSTSAVMVNLSTLTATGMGTDTLKNIENIIGSSFADTLTGDNKANIITGGRGGDKIKASGGNDTIVWAAGDGNDTVDGGKGKNTLKITGTNGADTVNLKNTTLSFNAADMAIYQMTNLLLFTGSGNDLVTVTTSKNSVIKSMTANLGDGDDTFNGTKSSIPFTVYGGKGNDNISTGSGIDNLFGGDGDDRISGGDGKDKFTGGAGADTFINTKGDKIVDLQKGIDQNPLLSAAVQQSAWLSGFFTEAQRPNDGISVTL